MRLAFTLTSYPPATGGAQVHFHELARRLVARHEVTVVRQWNRNREDWLLGSTVRAPHPHDEVLDGVRILSPRLGALDRLLIAPLLPAHYPLPELTTPLIASRLLRGLRALRLRPQLVHHGRIGREGLAYASLRWARELGVPFVLTPFHHPRWSGVRHRHWLRLYRQADRVIALTGAELELLVEMGVRRDRVVVLGHGPLVDGRGDGARFRARHGLSAAPLVLFLGQKYAYKGFEVLLAAAREVWRRHPEVQFAFLGPRTAASRRVFSAVSDRRILELDAVPFDEKCDALAACALLCLPSTQESFGGVFLEAWSYGKPVVGAPIPAVRSVIDDEVDGLLAEPDAPSLARALLRLLDDGALSQRLGAAGRSKVDQRYRWEALTERLERLYAELVDAPRGPNEGAG